MERAWSYYISNSVKCDLLRLPVNFTTVVLCAFCQTNHRNDAVNYLVSTLETHDTVPLHLWNTVRRVSHYAHVTHYNAVWRHTQSERPILQCSALVMMGDIDIWRSPETRREFSAAQLIWSFWSWGTRRLLFPSLTSNNYGILRG